MLPMDEGQRAPMWVAGEPRAPTTKVSPQPLPQPRGSEALQGTRIWLRPSAQDGPGSGEGGSKEGPGWVEDGPRLRARPTHLITPINQIPVHQPASRL